MNQHRRRGGRPGEHLLELATDLLYIVEDVGEPVILSQEDFQLTEVIAVADLEALVSQLKLYSLSPICAIWRHIYRLNQNAGLWGKCVRGKIRKLKQLRHITLQWQLKGSMTLNLVYIPAPEDLKMNQDLGDCSGLKMYSTGTVVVDKPRGSDIIEVYLDEKFTLTAGPISEAVKELSLSFEDAAGVLKKTSGKSTNIATAKWMGLANSNRETSPDVYRNEAVMVWRFMDTNDFYWTTLHRESALRGREDVLYTYSNKEAGAEATETNTHWVRFNAHDQFVQLHTSANNGEATTYDVIFDLRRGIFQFRDGHGNQIELVSPVGTLVADINQSITLNTRKVTVNASEKMVVNTPVYELNGETSTLNLSSSSEINAPSHTENSASVITNGLSARSSGSGAAVVMEGSVEIRQGDLSLTSGSLDVSGNVRASGDVYGSRIHGEIVNRW